ncbi:carboxymuconolactone decarboxylase family protein [Acidovorax sp. sic0104]|uniref:carboxymuconolactone decarboxylase family protein n=1 Tax=Acidovorax sp. sic0104 TaxID=2854784 RepID=UPI001C445113|nr:peroxidase-related enzyme [Acidovorax sp. sic0104]MBV7544086.1 peroxidase-related enzyme [Acidovorax sp. sic0104]
MSSVAFVSTSTSASAASAAARVPLVDRATASGQARTLLDQIHGAFGTTPNMFRAVAHSPAALQSMWSAFGALGGGVIGAALGEQIAVAVANRNACDYCLAAHTALGRKAGVSGEALAAAQAGESADPRTAAVLRFAVQLVDQRGQVDAADVQALRDQGLSDEHIVETVAHVALNLFTNYLNVALAVPVDFPGVKLRPAR